MAVYKITLNGNGGAGGTPAIWFDTVSASFFADSTLFTPINSVIAPNLACRLFDGFFSESSGGSMLVDKEGILTEDFYSLNITGNRSIYARWTRVSYKITLDDNSGSGGGAALYWKVGSQEEDVSIYSDDLCTVPATSVGTPSRSSYAFDGYYNGTSTLGAKYVNFDGSLAEAISGLSLSGDKTIYAKWVSAAKITVDQKTGSGGTTSFYFNPVTGKFFSDALLKNEIAAIVPMRRECYSYSGCTTTDSEEGEYVISYDGSISPDWVPSGSMKIYTRLFRISYKITVDVNGGTGGTKSFFKDPFSWLPENSFYADDQLKNRLYGVVLPTRSNYACLGLFDSKTGDVLYVSSDGGFRQALYALDIESTLTVYAKWVRSFKITLSKSSGSGGDDQVYFNPEKLEFYKDSSLTEYCSDVEIPMRECYRFAGYYDSAGSTQYIDGDGLLTEDFKNAVTGSMTVNARWERRSYKVTLNDNGGSGGSGKIYNDGIGTLFFSDDALTGDPLTHVDVPSRTGFTFVSYYSNQTSGGSRYVDGDGKILVAVPVTKSTTVYARWSAKSYTLAFDYDGGRGSVQSKTVTFSSPIGTLPTASRGDDRFTGWAVEGRQITESSIWDVPNNGIAVAQWKTSLGKLTDWFGLETSNGPLMLVASNSGAKRTVIETSHTGALAIQTGNSSAGAFERGGILLNPTCTYRIRKSGSVLIRLGCSWKRLVASESGYMLVSAEYATAADGEPVLVVRGAANEGAPAINSWSAYLHVNPDHIAQDPMGAVSGGGELTECKTLITCDPVVLMDNGMPCASDIVHGKVVVTATTNAYLGENAPTASSPFFETNGVPPDESDVDFTTYAFTAERSL